MGPKYDELYNFYSEYQNGQQMPQDDDSDDEEMPEMGDLDKNEEVQENHSKEWLFLNKIY